ncbi:uncharacterized protein LOC100206085 isoform X3 [Hydra vulgaris]|uniref:uncharacterized protein LOC100206085 isoform X3 n=1 Tax=Hydra vulgaris TaxID=6087 RepID=UPI001F5FCE10|nr:uncharacterized protein LOC100206085 isoform X1 [Hydra vulgaris]XP_047138053.1 uncharacterized protein LOC100206085 isoform X1 [Hydra vulgaris]
MTESVLTDFSNESSVPELNDEILLSETSFQQSLQLQVDSGTEDDSEILYHIDNKYKTYNSAKRFFNSYASKTRVKSKKPCTDEMSSKEYFTLQFYNDSDTKVDAEKVPVFKGKSLKEAVEILLSKRDLSFNTHSVFLEASKTPLPLAFDSFPLGGNVLHVKANQEMQIDERIIMLMKGSEDKMLSGHRQKKTEINESSIHNGKFTPVNGKLNRKTGLFNSLKDMSRNISDMLAQHTIDNFDNGDNNDSEFDNEVFLEDSWTDVITEVSELSPECRIQQEAIWELLMTEKNYIRKIRVIIKVFQKYLVNLQESGILTEVDPNKLFSNILEVYEANMVFWTKHLNLVVKDVRRTKQTINPLQLLDSFSNFDEIFNPYIHYCMEEANCVKYLKSLKRQNEFFVEYLSWCEENHQCMRLKLADLLVKPMQRITKYNLLLKVILHNTHDQEDCLALENMITQVEQFVRKINTTLRLRQEEQKLDAVLEKLELYLPIESASDEIEKHVAEYCNFDLRARIPGLAAHEKRFLLYDGPMKIVEKNGRIDVQAFLFTDVLIMTKPKRGGEKYRIVRQPYCLSKVVLHVLAGSLLFVYLNEYGVMSTAFTLLLNPNEQSKWIEAIDKAKTLYEKARKGNGSTLDFFDDDVTLPSLSAHSHSPSSSPLLFQRNNSDTACNLLENYKDELSSYRYNCKSSEGIIGQEHSVKRSLSDPKPRALQSVYGETTGKKTKNRPASFVSTNDKASWVLTDRELSGSLLGSVLSRRSSGLGDSFRSVNSDTCLGSHFTDLQNFRNFSDISNSEKIKKFGVSDHLTNITVTNQSHSLNNVSELTNKDIDLNSSIGCNQNHYSLQFPKFIINGDNKEELDHGTCVDSSKVLTTDDSIHINSSTENIVKKQLKTKYLNICVKCNKKTADSSTQYDECDFKTTQKNFCDISLQTDYTYQNVATQCGDFIHLNSYIEDSNLGIETANSSIKDITYRGNSTPLLDMLANSLRDHPSSYVKNDSLWEKKGKLKHAYSEANIFHAKDQYDNVIHFRSRSDEQHVPLKRKNSSQNDGPGMRALLVLSESLESSLQRSSNSQIFFEKEPERSITKGFVTKSNNAQVSPLQNSNKNSAQISPSNNKTLQSSTLYVIPKVDYLDKADNPTNKNVVLRNKPVVNYDNNVRNTWNEVDSLAALERIEFLDAIEHRRSSFDHRPTLDHSISQSQADIFDHSKKKSFKKEFFKRFSLSQNFSHKSDLSHKQDSNKKKFKEKFFKKKEKKQEKEENNFR